MPLIALLVGLAWAAPEFNLRPTPEQFAEICREHRQNADRVLTLRPRLGVIRYLPVASLRASQARKDHKNVLKFIADGADKQGPLFRYDGGRAAFAPERKVRGIYYRGHVYTKDGHSRVLASIYLGAKTLPVLIDEDRSELSPRSFLASLERDQVSYLRDPWGQPVDLVDFCEMVDDPYLHLARKLTLRVKFYYENGRFEIYKVKGAKHPAAIKLNSDIPFFEFEIADALHREGFQYKAAKDLTEKDRTQIFEALQSAKRKQNSRLNQILLLDRPQPRKELDLLGLLSVHLSKKACELQLATKEKPSEI